MAYSVSNWVFRPSNYIMLYDEWVRNARYTSLCNSYYSSWREFWEQRTRLPWPEECSVYDCRNPARYGAHVRVNQDNRMFIIPMCPACNSSHSREWFLVEDETFAVIIKPEDTSGPQQVCSSVPQWPWLGN